MIDIVGVCDACDYCIGRTCSQYGAVIYCDECGHSVGEHGYHSDGKDLCQNCAEERADELDLTLDTAVRFGDIEEF